MHAGLLDVLHDAADQHVRAVAHRVHVDLDGQIEKAVEQHRAVVGNFHRIDHVLTQVILVEHHFHGAPAEHVARTHDQRETDFARHDHGRLLGARRGIGGLLELQARHQFLEPLPVLGDIDAVGRGPDDRRAGGGQRTRQLERRLAAVLHDHPHGLFLFDDLHDIFERERLEIQAVGRVVIRRHRLRIAIHHDGFKAILAQRHGGVHAAVIEFDALTDAIRSPAEDHDLAPRRGRGLAFLLVGRIQVRGGGRKFGRAGIDALVHRVQPQLAPLLAHRRLIAGREMGDARIGKTLALEGAHASEFQTLETLLPQQVLFTQQVLDLR